MSEVLVSEVSASAAVFSIIGSRQLRPAALRSTASIFKNFFFLQYKAALLPGRYPVSRADHRLDQKIPFRPDKVEIYLDFLHFFIRVQGFLIRTFGKKVHPQTRDFIAALGEVYKTAAAVYSKNFSTTNRPRYLSKLRFAVIHAFDPHLMCIPSLHVMVLILTYTRFKKITHDPELNTDPAIQHEIEAVRSHALAITEAVLYIKQHSVNCISAAMYAMTRFDNNFPPEEAEAFAGSLFADADDIPDMDKEEIRSYILGLYRQFLERGRDCPVWETPLLEFLDTLPKV
ncbi:MAG: hypothetical protein FWD78_14090 [Treponema sp.]|nr:hypothetical protein [Treponema sp.]